MTVVWVYFIWLYYRHIAVPKLCLYCSSCMTVVWVYFIWLYYRGMSVLNLCLYRLYNCTVGVLYMTWLLQYESAKGVTVLKLCLYCICMTVLWVYFIWLYCRKCVLKLCLYSCCMNATTVGAFYMTVLLRYECAKAVCTVSVWLYCGCDLYDCVLVIWVRWSCVCTVAVSVIVFSVM